MENIHSHYRQEEQVTNRTQHMEEDKKKGIVLPTAPRKATAVNARSMTLYGKSKVGKTTALSALQNCLIIDTENGSAFINGIVMQVPETLGPVGRFKWLKELAAEIKAQGRPYDYVAIDTFSQLDIDSEWVGTWNYMNSVAGKNFNRVCDADGKVIKDPITQKTTMLKPTDQEYESVLTLGQGYGYRYSRDAIMDIFNTLKDLGKICTIFVCHVADKMIAEKNGEQVMIKDLALTGKVRDMIPRLCDAIGNVWNENGKMMVSFVGNSDKIGGMRATHLLGYTGELDWSKVFIKEETNK